MSFGNLAEASKKKAAIMIQKYLQKSGDDLEVFAEERKLLLL